MDITVRIYGLFSDAFRCSQFVASHVSKTIHWIERDVDASCFGIIWETVLAYVWMDEKIHKKTHNRVPVEIWT
jgi:hypothetical protein